MTDADENDAFVRRMRAAYETPDDDELVARPTIDVLSASRRRGVRRPGVMGAAAAAVVALVLVVPTVASQVGAPEPRPSIPADSARADQSPATAFPTNESGLTYGEATSTDPATRPDLVAVTSDEGIAGYVYADELYAEGGGGALSEPGPGTAEPDDLASAMDEAQRRSDRLREAAEDAERSASPDAGPDADPDGAPDTGSDGGSDDPADRILTVYASDGLTAVGTLSVPATTTDPSPTSFPSARNCQMYVPRELPSGAPPGPSRPSALVGGTTWGTGPDEVTVLLGQEAADGHGGGALFPGIGDPVSTDLGERTVTWVGDPPASPASISFLSGGCPVVVYIGMGVTTPPSSGSTPAAGDFGDPFEYAERL